MTQAPDGTRPQDPGITPLDRLASAASALLEELEALGQDAGRQFTALAKRSQRNRRMIRIVVVSLVLDVLLTAAVGFGLFQVDSNADRIDDLTQRLDVAQSETRRKAFCPLYEIFLGSKSEQGRKAAADPKAYDRAFDVIESGYRALDCAEFTNGATPFGNTPKGE
ncbi:hypothetical protein [Streptomyces sp. NRRL S-920]|uniref:hypothetical protein n=1 Tax=Streptomyces sp. NRRL S-920 TaxID=1463921 RepID=UPI0004C91550|nr:hypothetical protein [Streptomyces sp. NRRL S-920]